MKRMFLALLMTIISFYLKQLTAQWAQTNGPNRAEVNCFESIGENLFIGTNGGVYLSTDNGTSWTLVDDGLWSSSILALEVSGTVLFAATDGAGVFRSMNNGTTWAYAGNGLEGSVSSLAVIDPYLFAGEFRSGAGVLRSSDQGSSWIPAGLTTDKIKSLVVLDTVLFAQTENAGVFRSADYGNNWVSVNTGLPKNTALSLLTPFDTSLYVGTSVGLYQSRDYGASWTALDFVSDDMVLTSASIETTLFVGTGNGEIYSMNDGTGWTTVATGLYHTCLYASGSDLFAGTSSGVLRSTNYGKTWTEFNTGLASTLVYSLVSKDANLYAGTGSGLFRSSDSGNSWIHSGPGGVSLAINGSNFYIGSSGHVVCSMDNGVNWEWVHVEVEGWIRALVLSGTDIFAGLDGADAGVYRITCNAPGWWTITQTTLKDIVVHSLAVKDKNIFAGTERGVFLSTNNGTNWIAVNNGLPDLAVRALAINNSNIFAGTEGGGVFRSVNNGSNWIPANTGLTWRDVISLEITGDTIFAGTWRGGVFLSTNNGDSWSAVNAGLTDLESEASMIVHSLAVFGQNIYAGTRGASVWRRPLSEMITSVESISSEPSLTFSLEQNYPNPFNPLTTINFQVPKSARITIKIYDILGREIRTLTESIYNAGNHSTTWDGLDNFGHKVNSGVYFYYMESVDFKEVKKALLLK